MIKIEIAKPVQKKLKVLLYGSSGSGKTIAALSFPRVLMIDAESGSDLYAGRPGIKEFYRVRAKTLSEVNEVLDAVEKDNGKTWDTLVIDPITVLYDVEKNVGSANNTKDMTFKAWGRVNMRMTALYNRLAALNVHIVVIAREAVEYAGEGQDLKKVGVKPEADKKSMYLFDFVIRLKPDHNGIVEKSRGVQLGKAGLLDRVDWSTFEPIANLYTTGQKVETESDEEAAAKELDAWSAENATEWQTKWTGLGMTPEQLRTALKITGRLSEWKGTVSQADTAVEAYRKPVTLPPDVAKAKAAAETLRTTYDVTDPNAFDKAVKAGVEESKSAAYYAEQERLDREAARTALNGETLSIYKVTYKPSRNGQGLLKWEALAHDINDTSIPVVLWGEDVKLVEKAGHKWPETDGENLDIPVMTKLEGKDRRIKSVMALDGRWMSNEKDTTRIDEGQRAYDAMPRANAVPTA